MSAANPRASSRRAGQSDQHFKIRMWLELDYSEKMGHSWRGHVRHANSGQASEFIGLEGLFDFIREKAKSCV